MEKLAETTLHVAATRPALLAGLPIQLATVFIMAAGIIGVVMHNALYGLLVSPLWGAATLLVRRDYNAVRVAGLWLRTSASALDSHHWGGASVSNFPVRQSRRARGIPGDAW